MVLISYDLNGPGQKYQKLISAIQGLGKACKCLESTWIVRTNRSPSAILDYLYSFIDSNDRLVVIAYDPASMSGFLSQDTWDRLKNI